jgi:hypothetical protein
MHLGMSKSKNSTSLYVLKSTYENGFHSTEIVEKLGTIEEMEKKLNGQDPVAWAKQHIAQLNKLEKQDKHEVTAKYSPVKIIQKDEQRSFNGGYLFLQEFYAELGFHEICAEIKKKHKLDFNLDAILSRLIYSRIIYPSTKLSYYDSANLFIEPPDFTPKQVTKGLRVLAAEKDFVTEKLYENSRKQYGINTDQLFYDSTICLYETSTRKETSAPIIPMELYFDGNLMPLTYRCNPEHLKTQPDSDVEKKIRDAYHESRTVTTSDGGITSGAGKQFKNWGLPNSYIMTLSFDQLHEEEKTAALDRDGWTRSDSGEIYNLNQLRLDDEIKNPSRYYYKELAIGSLRTIITYSEAKVESTRLQHEIYLTFHQSRPTPESTAAEVDLNTKAGAEGIQAYVTNLKAPAKKIIHIAAFRQSVHDYFRILSMEVPEKGSNLSQAEQTNAHFITCYSALTVYSALLRKLKVEDTSNECMQTLRQMNFMKIHSEGYIPLYTRTDLTDLLHESAGFRTDYEIVNSNYMNKLIKAGRKK